MIDPQYCFERDERPAATQFHEEALSLVPPGPECRFTLADGTTVTRGPGPWPAASLAAAVAAAVLVLRLAGSRASSSATGGPPS